MPTLNFRVTTICSGGNHYTMEITGDLTRTLVVDREAIQAAERLDPEIFALALLRYYARGRTQNQIRTALQNGIAIQVGLA